MHKQPTIAGIFIAIALLSIVICLPYLDTLQLWHEEPRRALIAEDMKQSGNYIVPRYMEEIYVAKPPLYNWLVIAVSLPFGEISELSIRLTSFICLLLLIASMLMIHQRWLGIPSLTFLALALALSPEFINKATLGEIDISFTLLVSLSLWLWFSLDKKQVRGIVLWLIPGVLISLAFLAKREPAFIFYYVGLGAYLLYQRRLLELFQPAHLVSAAITLGIVGIWLWQMHNAVGIDTLMRSSVNELFNRGLVGSLISTGQHMVTYPFEIGLAIFPFSLILITLLHRQTRTVAMQLYPDVLTFASITAVANFLVYWFVSEASVRYFLPMLPSVLVICAILYQIALETTPKWIRNIAIGISIFTLLLAILLNLFLHQGLFGLGTTPPAILASSVANTLAICAVFLALASIWVNIKGPHLLAALVILMMTYRVIYYDVLLPRKVAQFQQERDVATFVSHVYENVPVSKLPVGASKALPHEIWWQVEYGDITRARREYFLTDEPPSTSQSIISTMNFRGREIFLLRQN